MESPAAVSITVFHDEGNPRYGTMATKNPMVTSVFLNICRNYSAGWSSVHFVYIFGKTLRPFYHQHKLAADAVGVGAKVLDDLKEVAMNMFLVQLGDLPRNENASLRLEVFGK